MAQFKFSTGAAPSAGAWTEIDAGDLSTVAQGIQLLILPLPLKLVSHIAFILVRILEGQPIAQIYLKVGYCIMTPGYPSTI